MSATTTETYGRTLYLWALVFFSALSVVGNAVYAYRAVPATVEGALPPGWAAAAHVIPPIALLIVTEVVAAASTRLPAGRARWVGLVGAGVIAAAAFALSFDALYAVAEMAKVRSQLAWLVPVMLDVAIVVCTVLALTASERVRADRQPSIDQSVGRANELDRAPDERPAERADQVETTSAEMLAHRPTERSTAPEQAVRPVDRSDEVAGQPDRTVAEVSDRPSESPVDRPENPTERPTAADARASPVESTPADQPTDSVTIPTSSTDVSTDWVELAERVLATTSVTADADDLAHVLALDAAGLSRQKIADEVGRAKSTVGGWIKAAEGTNDSQRHQALVAVSK